MTDTPSERTLSIVVRRALLREALQNIEAGQRLYDGRWLSAGDYRTARRARWSTGVRETVEALLFWGIGALIGIGLMVVVVAIL